MFSNIPIFTLTYFNSKLISFINQRKSKLHHSKGQRIASILTVSSLLVNYHINHLCEGTQVRSPNFIPGLTLHNGKCPALAWVERPVCLRDQNRVAVVHWYKHCNKTFTIIVNTSTLQQRMPQCQWHWGIHCCRVDYKITTKYIILQCYTSL